MKKKSAIILSSLILGFLLAGASAASAQTVWVACSFDTSSFVPQKGRPDRFERRMYVTDVISMSKRAFLAADEGNRIEGNCGDYFEKTVLKAATARGERIDTGGTLRVYRTIDMSGANAGSGNDPYTYAPREAVEKKRAEAIQDMQGADRVIYSFNWDTTGRNEAADFQRETSGVAPVSSPTSTSNAAQLIKSDDGSGDVKEQLAGLITLPANQIPLKQPKFLVVNGLKEDANYVFSGYDPADILKKSDRDSRDYQDASATRDRSASGLQKLKTLLEAGTPLTETIELKNGNLTLGELASLLLDYYRNAMSVVMINKLEQNTMRVRVWVNDVGTQGKLGRVEVEQALSSGEDLQKSVIEAQHLGFPDEFKITIESQDYTLPQLKEMGHYVATAGGQLKAAEDAARAAKDAPYLKVLSGDKARIFKEEFGGQDGMWEAYGTGGQILSSPAAMSGSSVWFTYGNSRGIVDTWHVTGWKFQGDKLVGRISKSGFGLKPSAAAYR